MVNLLAAELWPRPSMVKQVERSGLHWFLAPEIARETGIAIVYRENRYQNNLSARNLTLNKFMFLLGFRNFGFREHQTIPVKATREDATSVGDAILRDFKMLSAKLARSRPVPGAEEETKIYLTPVVPRE
jgi:hypothetical protein